MEHVDLKGINIKRLMKDIDDYACYGLNAQNGITRPSFSEEDIKVRKKFIRELKALGLEVKVDGAANIWAKKKGNGNKKGSIVIGSHLDSVPNGGKFDGPLGVLMAKELLVTLEEQHILLDHDLEIVSFTAEESNDFNLSTFGSRSFSGKLDVNDLKQTKDSSGIKVVEALKRVGGDIEAYSAMYKQHDEKKAFIELHIEQGKQLEEKNTSIASVARIAGIYRNKLTVTGEANHSGATKMNTRIDALTAASEMILQVEEVSHKNIKEVVGTVGKLEVSPNATNIIPGQVEFTLEIRGKGSESSFRKVIADILNRCKEIAVNRRADLQQEIIMDQSPILLDRDLVNILNRSAANINEPCLSLTSMAVHDAAHMAAVTKSAMLFVKSVDGKSHCPEEYSTPEDIAIAGKVLLNSIIDIDKFLK
ncbi:M20 family metallo-hydrolase [Alteribacillus bidgolensis]|uniref:N-carbamoyl-L-amino-acid hydrolase n=1 Tax=Alteribacillus bidgolensis TaxID=930129 RepID=A0A1G8IF45_9BACI|nr:M20 family metallo-hydrolase [Alteribacillus bidgolensis]SDI17170.1 N-carbamoyl-L-amino-acid hydrolase [Alteribacillus bidgolensis]